MDVEAINKRVATKRNLQKEFLMPNSTVLIQTWCDGLVSLKCERLSFMHCLEGASSSSREQQGVPA